MNILTNTRTIVAYINVLILSILAALMISGTSSALSGSDFKAGRIIDDAYFYNGTTMSPDEIQNFLNAKVVTCDTWGQQPYAGTTRAQYGASRGYPAPYTCLKDYRQDTGYKAGQSGLCSAIEAKTNRSAAQIIDDVARACHISQKVIIVMLQKEQGLITDDWPWSIQYRGAMGYGCPDTAACDSQYYGFFNQVYNAALQFQRYKADPTYWNHVPFMTNNVLYQANAPSCGSRSVYIENYATAGLYNYTPYTPNTAALNNLYGSGDSCSAYGNRNFWRYYSDWFGSTLGNDTLSPHPDGTLIHHDGRVYIIESNKKRHIASADIFESYRYEWNKIKPATTGDRSLSLGDPVKHLNPAGLYKTATDGVFVLSTPDSGTTWQKRYITYDTFTKLGYNWDTVLLVSSSSLPAVTVTQNYSSDRHSNGQLISLDGRVYMIDHNTLRYVSGAVYKSYGWMWSLVSKGTDADRQYSPGARWLYRTGSIIFDGNNLYAIQIPPTGYEIKRPIGPWDCYSNKFKYNLTTDITWVSGADIPTSTGSNLVCQ